MKKRFNYFLEYCLLCYEPKMQMGDQSILVVILHTNREYVQFKLMKLYSYGIFCKYQTSMGTFPVNSTPYSNKSI